MGRIGGDIGKEGRVTILPGLDPTQGGGEEKVSAKTLGLHKGTVVANDRIKILVTGRISTAALVGLADPTGPVDERLIKSTRVRLVRLLIAQVPLAKNTTGIAGLLEDLREDRCLERHAFALKDGVGHSVLHRVPTGHNCATRGSTGRAHQKPREPRAGVIKLIEIWRANPRMPVPPNRAIALIIGDDQNNIRLLSLGG